MSCFPSHVWVGVAVKVVVVVGVWVGVAVKVVVVVGVWVGVAVAVKVVVVVGLQSMLSWL